MHATRPRRFALSVTALAGLVVAVGASGGAAVGGTHPATAGQGVANLLSETVGGPYAAPSGFAPTQIRNTYGFNAMGNDAHGNPIDGRGQIIGIVLWDSDATLQSDMAAFLKTYSYLEQMNGLTKTPCAVSHTIHTTPCFEAAYATGTKPPAMNAGAKAEASLDVQWAHVTAEGADILFVEAAGDTGAQLLVAVDKAVSMGASVVSMSWDQTGISAADNTHFDASTAGFVSGSGDFGCPDSSGQVYPSGSADVLSVGGTALTINGTTSVRPHGHTAAGTPIPRNTDRAIS